MRHRRNAVPSSLQTRTSGASSLQTRTSGTYVHLGYYLNNQTQGLQLCHWAKNLELKLVLHVIPLPDNLIDLAGVLEVRLAGMLLPLFGKHK